MINRPTLLTDVAELSNVLRAMDEWDTTGNDLDSVHDRRRFVDSLDDQAADELGGLALTNLARAVLEAKVAAGEPCKLGEDPFATPPVPRARPWYGDRRVAA